MKITVLMSTYNGETFLREQLDSILSQTIRKSVDFKVLIRDDGSTDSTLKILEEYKENHPNIVEYYTGENLKPDKSFWDLINTVDTSDYYAFADQDDIWLNFKLKRAVRALNFMGEGPKLYCSKVTTVDVDLNPQKSIHDKLNSFTDFPHSLIYSTAQGCTFVFNHVLLVKLRQYDMEENFVEHHDWLTHKIASMTGRMYLDAKPTMYYRQHGDNVIGLQNGGFEGFLRRVKMFATKEHESLRKECAKSLLNVYGQELPEKKKEVLKEVAYYTENSKYKKKFLRDKRFYPGGINTIFHIFLILVNRI